MKFYTVCPICKKTVREMTDAEYVKHWDGQCHPLPGGTMTEVEKLRKLVRHQRQEIRRLNACLRLRKYERFGRTTLSHYQDIGKLTRLLGDLVSNQAWNVGWRAGLRMFLSTVSDMLTPAQAERLAYEIAWRCDERPIDPAIRDSPWPRRPQEDK